MKKDNKKLSAYLIAYRVKKYRNVKIYPKVVDENPLYKFSKKEQKELTKRGKRWYLYYDFVHPGSNKYVRQTPITANINRDFPEFKDRYNRIHLLKEVLLERLNEGYSPYDEPEEKKQYNIIDSLAFALNIKKDQVGKRTYESYKYAYTHFKEWLELNYYNSKPIEEIDRRIVNAFLNHIAKKTSNRNRNNYKNSLRALYSILIENDYLQYNVFDSIKNLKTEPKPDPTYSDKQVKVITKYLQENDKILLMFIYFVSYLFWRPKENCRLKVKDINLEERLIAIQTKTKGRKTKRIPDILIDDLREYLKGANPEDLVFTPNGPGTWERQLDNRRHYFSDRYRKVKKELGLMEYSIYSFRHYSITKAYKKLRKDLTEDQAMQELSKYTGHDSKAIKAYIHYIDADATEDYSHLLK